MSEQKRILVIVDPTASSHPSIERAAWLARPLAASIELFISDSAPQLADPRSHRVAANHARAALVERHRPRPARPATTPRSRGARPRERTPV